MPLQCPVKGTTNPKSESANKDATFIRPCTVEPLLAEDKEIIIVCHSYGGVPKGGAIDEAMSVVERSKIGLKGGILGLIYMTSYILPAQTSILDLMHCRLQSPEMMKYARLAMPDGSGFHQLIVF